MRQLFLQLLIVSLLNLVLSQFTGNLCKLCDTNREAKCADLVKPLVTIAAKQKDEEISVLKSALDETGIRIKMLESRIENYKDRYNEIFKKDSQNTLDTVNSAQQATLFKLVQCKSESKLKDEKLAYYKNKVNANIASLKNNIETLQAENRQLVSDSCDTVGNVSLPHIIQLPGIAPFPVICEGRRDDGKWLLVLKREDNLVSFNRSWADYAQGFGDIMSSHFIGLEKLHYLTKSRPHELLIEMIDAKDIPSYARYDEILVGGEKEDYRLTLGKFTGDDGDGLELSRNMAFSTYDHDNDLSTTENCAERRNSGWWYNNCYDGIPDAPYKSDQVLPGWHNPTSNAFHHVKAVQIFISPKRSCPNAE